MEIVVKHFNDLTVDELYEICKIRIEIFMLEQCIYVQDLDDVDKSVYHMYLKDDDGMQAYVRIIPKGMMYEGASIGRVVSRKRHCGLGTEIMKAAISFVKERFGDSRIDISAQVRAREFYDLLGFVQTSDVYDECGVPHIHMVLELE
ncbi:MAG: GNAT family N-acetyltransferase [Candidatus Methanomethylophilaceae archaeon]|nr:GNAT family N-acetyltransferase [Candidatus Methanomethylophilaceae archaeon]